MVNKHFSRFLDGLFPYRCELCQLPSGRPLPLCRPCQEELPYNLHPCQRCGLPLDRPHVTCDACSKRAPTYSACSAPLLYTGPVRNFIRRLKYQQDLSLLPLLAEVLARDLSPRLEAGPRPDSVLPMPLHWRRLWWRGFNQSERLAWQLLRHPRIAPFKLRNDRGLCRRARYTAPQQGLDRSMRQRNLLGAFNPSPRVEGKYIAILDDVATTGASAELLAQALVDRGAARVDFWCCARTPAPAADNGAFKAGMPHTSDR